MDREEIRRLVRRQVEAALAGGGAVPPSPPAPRSANPAPAPPEGTVIQDFLSGRDVDEAHRAGKKRIHVGQRAVLTPLAVDQASSHGIEIVRVERRPGPGPGGGTAPSKVEGPIRRVAIGCDHGGFPLKEVLVKRIRELGFQVDDLGTHSTMAVDYPDYARAVARKVASGDCQRGVVIDGAGIGSSIVANKVPGIRAAHCRDLFETKNSREHNNANVLSLGARVIGEGVALAMIDLWLATPFEGGRHARRVEKMDEIDRAERGR